MITLTRAGPLTTLQDAGRFGMLAHGISASGPMDHRSYIASGALLPRAGSTAIEFPQGLALETTAPLLAGLAGGDFRLLFNGAPADWGAVVELRAGDRIEILPGARGNYGYLRFEREIDIAPVLGSRSTNVTVGLGGYKGRALRAGDRLDFAADGVPVAAPPSRGGRRPDPGHLGHPCRSFPE